MDQGLFITAELRVKPDVSLELAKLAIFRFCRDMESEPGCSLALPLQDREDPRKFILWERYDDEAAHQAHFDAEHTQRFIQQGLTELVQAFQSELLIPEL
ncbi:putative quinol monooxygenase [Ferrimonas futtsuensis]|uniref:putative quinol monooxygenase n=1 Tax=Ferrimonas futtsuensis TaxID=364764 RepID=UPI00042A54CB|nr:antibiotic biosynthesis monooxygenase [Ferrimonas futtsuensis]